MDVWRGGGEREEIGCVEGRVEGECLLREGA